jgi:hypothetical protein
MKKPAQALCFGLLLSSALTSPVVAQTTDTDTGTPLPLSSTAADLTVLPRIGAGFTTTGAGYQEPFFSLEGFVPLQQTPGSTLTFLEGRLLFLTDSTMGGNLLLGQRFYSSSQNRILGGYISYDVRDTGNSVFNQIGAGFERLGDDWDLRVNAYLPVGYQRQQLSESFSNPAFQENFLLFDRRRQFEAAMAGFDVEAGGRLLRLGEGDLRGYAGVYYYGAEGSENAFGIRGRVEARPTDNLRLGLSVQNDPIFDTKVVLSLGFNFPGTRPRGVNNSSALARMGESVYRTATITVDEQKKKDTVVAINPNTGTPWQFRHVKLGMETGNGTFENPTGTVQDALNLAQPNEIVYVQFGENSGIPAFTIPDKVLVLSTGPVQRIETVQLGSVQLPLSGSGDFPQVVGTVTLGNDTTLSGFAIANVTGNGIQASEIQNVTIRDNRITDVTGQGISLNNVTGTSAIALNSITNSGGQGIFVQAVGNKQQQFTLDSNSITNSGGQGIFVAASGDAQQQFTANANTVSGSVGQGIFVQANNNTRQTFEIKDSTINRTRLDSKGEGGQGLFVAANGGAQQNFTLDNTQVTTSAGQGVFVAANGATSDRTIQTRQTFTINTPTVSDSTGQGVFVQANGNTQQEFEIKDSTINRTSLDSKGEGGQGLFVAANGGAQQNFTLDNTQVTTSAGQGVFVAANGATSDRTIQTRQTFTINTPTVSDSTGQGVFVQANSNTQQEFAIKDSTINRTSLDSKGEGGQGLFVAANGGAQQNFTLDNTKVTTSAGQGLFVAANGSPSDRTIQTRQKFTINTPTVSESAGQGVFVQANGNTQQEFEIKNSTINRISLDSKGEGGQGLFVAANGGAQQNFTLDNPNVTASAAQGLFVAANGDPNDPTIQTRQKFTLNSPTVNDSTGQGIFVQANGNTQQEFEIKDSTINRTRLDSKGEGGQGLFVGANGEAQQNFTVENATVTDTAGQGIFVAANGNAQEKFSLRNNTITNSALDGIFIQANENAKISANVEFNILKNKTLPGFTATTNSAQTFCLGLNGNNSTTNFQLQRNAGTFQVIERDNLSTSNTGTVNFAPGVGDFKSVPACP